MTYAGLSLCRVFATFPVQFDTSLGRRPVASDFLYILPIVLEFTQQTHPVRSSGYCFDCFNKSQIYLSLYYFLKIMPPKKNSVASKASTNTPCVIENFMHTLFLILYLQTTARSTAWKESGEVCWVYRRSSWRIVSVIHQFLYLCGSFYNLQALRIPTMIWKVSKVPLGNVSCHPRYHHLSTDIAYNYNYFKHLFSSSFHF